MKVMFTRMLLLVSFSLSVSVATAQHEMLMFRVVQDVDGSYSVYGSLDLLSLGRKEQSARELRKAEIRERRQGMSAMEVVRDHVSINWGKYLSAIVAVAVDRMAYNNDWIYYKWTDDNTKKVESQGVEESDKPAVVTTDVSGSGNTINQTVIIQQTGGAGNVSNDQTRE